MGQTLAREMATERQEVVDLKLVRHPGILPEDKTKWADWKFSFVNYLTLVDDLYSDELNGAETHDKPVRLRGMAAAGPGPRAACAVSGAGVVDRSA